MKEAPLKNKRNSNCIFFPQQKNKNKNATKTKEYHIKLSIAKWHFQLDNLVY